MPELLWLIPALPLASAILLLVLAPRSKAVRRMIPPSSCSDNQAARALPTAVQ